jgi:hypothetical protein
LIEKVHYNENSLADSIYGYAFVGKNYWLQTFKYDSLKNITQEMESWSYKKGVKMISTNYIYNAHSQIMEKLITTVDPDWPTVVFHYKYEYNKRGMKEIRIESYNDSISSVREFIYDEKGNLVLFQGISGYGKGEYAKYKYDSTKRLILSIEMDHRKEIEYIIYEK